MDPMKARLTVPAVLVLLFAVAACDSAPAPEHVTSVSSFEVIYHVQDVTFSGPYALVQFREPRISPGVVEDGAVLAYARIAETWTALPYTYGVESLELPAVDYTVTLGYAFSTGLLEVFYDLSVTDPDLQRDIVFERLPERTLIKVVVIEDFLATRRAVDVSSYEAVRRHFGLEE